MRYAACTELPEYPDQKDGFDPFFPRRGEAAQALKEAKRICASCPVIDACAEYRRLTGSKFGIWAGQLFSPETL